ncbi:unnamed protein product [Gemmataceae bacterium]|nr:unnamed protein product [Gemmataceae bacterium]VTU02721.1 unnamed protein product [Gemmataceae bacterium]
MSQVTIKRCPDCQTIRDHTPSVVDAIKGLGMHPRVEDGVAGEFAVLVDGVPVIQRNGDTLPTPGEIEAAVENAAATPTT